MNTSAVLLVHYSGHKDCSEGHLWKEGSLQITALKPSVWEYIFNCNSGHLTAFRSSVSLWTTGCLLLLAQNEDSDLTGSRATPERI